MNTKLPYEGATVEQLRHPLVREFLAIHNMFRGELNNMLRFVDTLRIPSESTNGDDPKGQSVATRIQTLAQATYRYTQLLHFHHHGESSGLFPALQSEGLEGDVIQRLEADHDEIARLIEQLESTLHATATIEPQAVNRDLQRLAEVLRAHLAYEENHVCPLLTHFSHWPMFAH